MAERRMFHGAVVESDAFLDLPVGAQALYFHLGMQADDDGFVNGPKQIAKNLNLDVGSLDVLEENGFRNAVIKAISAANQKSIDLGK